MAIEAVAKAKFQRFGPRKVNQVCGEIRGKSLLKAEQILPQLSRGAVVLVTKTLKSAAANLNVKAGKPLNPAETFIKSAWVGYGPMKHMKRVMPGPQGRANQFKRKVCHLTIVVADAKQGK